MCVNVIDLQDFMISRSSFFFSALLGCVFKDTCVCEPSQLWRCSIVFMSCFLFLVKLSGSLSDPGNIAGLAHFCEHMLFLGTKKYPKENEYSQFLSEHAGSSNAFTSGEHTNYYFDISHEHLQGALDRSGVNSLKSFVRILLLYLFLYSFLKAEAPP